MATLHIDANAPLVRVIAPLSIQMVSANACASAHACDASSVTRWRATMQPQSANCAAGNCGSANDGSAQLWQRSGATTDTRLGFLVDGVPNGIRTRVFTVKG
jgi:hypothetical protein